MELGEIELDEMTPLMLDWAVAVALGHNVIIKSYRNQNELIIEDWMRVDAIIKQSDFSPTTNDRDCGILIDRYLLGISHFNAKWSEEDEPPAYLVKEPWICSSYEGNIVTQAADRKVAAARNVVAAEFGFVVKIPLELVEK